MQDKSVSVLNDRLLFYGFLLLVIWLPLPFGGNRPMYWWVMEIWVLLLAIAWLMYFLSGRLNITEGLKKAKVPITLLVFVCMWIGIQSVSIFPFQLSVESHGTHVQVIKSVCYVLVFSLALLLVTSRKRLELLALVIIYGGTFQALVAIMVNGNGLFINRNHFAGYMEMTLAVGIGLMIAHLDQGSATTWRENLRRWIRTILGHKARVRICLALMVIGLIVSRSVMGNTAFFTSMLIAGLVGLLLFRKSNRSVVILFASMIVIDFLLMGSFFGIDKLQERAEQKTMTIREVASEGRQDDRVNVQKLSLPIINEHLIAGTGAGSFYSIFPRYRDEETNEMNLHAHSDLIEFPAELGLIGVVPLALVVLLSFFTSIKVQYQRRSPFFKAMGFPATMGIIAIMMHSSVDFNLQITANAATFMVLLAMPYMALTIGREKPGLH